MSMNSLLRRIEELEQRAAPDVCYVAYRLPDGTIPPPPGKRNARYLAVMPQVCETVEEWEEKHARPMLERAQRVQAAAGMPQHSTVTG